MKLGGTRKKSGSHLEKHFAFLLVASGVGDRFRREYRFHPTRRWRFDFADPALKVAVECEGGVFLPNRVGGHNRGGMYRENCDKYNAAAVLGWIVLRYVDKTHMNQFITDYQEIRTWRSAI